MILKIVQKIITMLNKLNELNSKLALLESLVSEQFIYIKKSLQEINDPYQRNKNTSTYTTPSLTKYTILKKKTK